MTDYKLVPVIPTAEMLAAGEYALEFGCYASGIYADMLAAAPAVQAKPVLGPRTVDTTSTDSNSEQEQFSAINMDTAVQTEPVAWIVPDFGFLFPTEEAAQRYLRNINDLRKPIALYAASQPTPDVTKLVEALEAVMEFGCDPKSNRGRWALEKAESALAAYRKGVQI